MLAYVTLGATPVAAQSVAGWTRHEADRLKVWAARAPEDALPALDTTSLDDAIASGDGAAIDGEATALALRLARWHLLGAVPASRRAGWHITDTDSSVDLRERLARALAMNSLDSFFEGLRPAHRDYAALRRQYGVESDPARRRTLALNMERWRWMPRVLGSDYILVNAAAFEARLSLQGREPSRWRVIVGKRSTPTPIFSAQVTGVILNPWWTVPASIVREKRGVFPASAGYVRSGGQVRQKPGPTNALGEMKLDMPNPYTVYMHDTPSKALFDREVRAFSHGCVRVDHALDFARTLLAGTMSREQIDAVVARRVTTTVPLERALPVYIAYFTASASEEGGVAFHPDIYGRDARQGMAEVTRPAAVASSDPASECGQAEALALNEAPAAALVQR
ncbi:L,D-transpeptidase [Novosphingobium sp. PC22D]|uniref:L,D-transpeptidase family protein n=1 Tax=Novosphingobium sp. PC22D TaxID=1962403 RepID=UPI000BFB0D27|nr:L,D-transpeptidase family protein [Novosphingobium sp. PC22D]PEQ13791.1 L,D-transpeptidase [Novosphingobium sp. PC22D]